MVTPSPTLDINRKKREENIANRQAMIANGIVPDLGVQTPITPISPTTITPAPIVNAPVDQNTGLSKPLEPVAQPVQPAPIVPATPVQAEVKTPEVKPVVASSNPISKASNVPPIDYTQAKGREQDIINNLNTFKAQNMTPEQIMKASDYQNATPEKKALIDPYLKVQVPTASAMYNNIVAKADIPDEQKTSLPYKIANNRYMKANMYSTMTPSQLSSEMTNSKLIQGSQAYEDLKAMNPKLIQDTENLRIVNGSKNNLFTYVNNPDGTTKKVNNLEETFKNDFLDNFAEEIKKMFTVQTPEQIRAIIRTPDVVSAEDKAFEYEGKINEIDKQIEASDAEVEARMAGSGATGNRIALEKSMARDKFNKDRDSMVKEYTRYANKANNLTTQNMTMYTTQQQQQQAQNTAMLPFITDQYKTAQAKSQAEQALQDPATQIGQTMQEFEKMGITSQGSLASKIAEFNKSGLSLPEYVNNLRKLYMAKPEYQRIQNQEAGKGISYQTIGDSVYRQNADGSLTKTNISANKTKDPVWQEWTDSNGVKQAGWITPGVNPTVSTGTKPTGNIVPVTAGNKTVRLDQSGASGFESAINQLTTAGIPIVVGQGARDQTATIKEMADRYGIAFNASNPAETAQKLRSAGHQVADPGKSNHESGMAIDVYGSSKLDAVTPEQEKILNANGWYSAGIPGDAGHFEYRGGGQGTQSTGTFTATEEAWANNIMNGKAKISDITNKDGVDKGKVLQLMNQKTGGTTGTMQTNIQSGLEIVNKLINHPGRTSVTGAPSIFTNPFGYSLTASDARDFKGELKRMEAIGFLNMIPQMQGMGALSNSEGSRLAAAYSKLADTGIPEENYLEELNRLKEGMEKALKNMGATIPEEPKQATNTGVGQLSPEVQSIENEWLNR